MIAHVTAYSCILAFLIGECVRGFSVGLREGKTTTTTTGTTTTTRTDLQTKSKPNFLNLLSAHFAFETVTVTSSPLLFNCCCESPSQKRV